MINDTKDTSTSHPDDELDFHEFEAFDDPMSHTANSTNAFGSAAQQEYTSSTSSKRSSSFDHLDFGGSRYSRNPVKFVVIGVVILLVIAFIVYHLLSSRGGISWMSGASKPPTVAAPVSPPQPAVDALLQAQEQKTSELANKVTTFDQTLTQQQQTIDQMQATMSSLQDSVNTLNNTVSTVSQQLTTLDQKIAKPVKKAQANLPPAPPPLTYVIKALVPGRAWLLASNGALSSVAVGNAIPDHGVVTQIDLNAGQVVTSDGSVFVYDLNAN